MEELSKLDHAFHTLASRPPAIFLSLAKSIIPANSAPSDAFLAPLSVGKRLDIWRVCLLCYLLTIDGKRIVPRELQLCGLLATMRRRNSVVYSGCGTGKTLFMVLPLLWNLKSVSIIISPLKRLQANQVDIFSPYMRSESQLCMD
ncbi:hypothetical protein OE88DRAFT_26914 [Heliocybe sulcata]|uniref:DEAD/DEAH box helicase domain-containing protein n=1 Tax=Heliocybe sulcata TaxID=5364 RepID=A0A5C3NK45_9AGAM|nr:hypothetical protein OE88DRAFT_26914 [Heliocybe sulcata]